MKYILNELVKYVTNHIVSHIPFSPLRHAWYSVVLGWSIGAHSSILMGQQILMGSIRKSGKGVSIGSGTRIDEDCLLYTTGGLVIGKNVRISPGSWLITGYHDLDHNDLDLQFKDMYKPITIEDSVWIGERVTILAGVTIGKEAIIRPGSVVARDVPAYSIVEGVPAKVIRQKDAKHCHDE